METFAPFVVVTSFVIRARHGMTSWNHTYTYEGAHPSWHDDRVQRGGGQAGAETGPSQEQGDKRNALSFIFSFKADFEGLLCFLCEATS